MNSGDTVTMLTGRTVPVEEARRILEVDPIIQRFGTWAVTDYGVECLTSRYAIPKERIYEPEWIHHMIGNGDEEKRGHWVVADDFVGAIQQAREHFRKRPVAIAPKVESPKTPGKVARPRRHKLSNSLRFWIFKRDGYRCQMCGIGANTGRQLDIDHKIARKNGGTDEESNLWVLCSVCNNGKGTEDL